MDKQLNHYLAQVEHYLHSLPASERIDIAAEIKSQMLELQAQAGLSPQEVLERLGDARSLALAYLGDTIVRHRFSPRRLLALLAFGGMAGLGGMFVLPFFGVLAFGLLLSGILAPLAGFLKAGGYLFGIDLPFVVFQFGSWEPHPLLGFLLSLLLGVFLLTLGVGCWKLTKCCVQAISKAHRVMQGTL